jgi:hypothetical protein
MDILYNTLKVNTNKCVYTSYLEPALDTDNTILKPILLLHLICDLYNGSRWIDIKKGCNVLYFITEKYKYQDITDYLLYLDVNRYDCDVNLSKYLIYLSYSMFSTDNDYIPYIVYLGIVVEDSDPDVDSMKRILNYKNLQYFDYDAYADETHLYIDKSYLTVAKFYAKLETFTYDSVYLRDIVNKHKIKRLIVL